MIRNSKGFSLLEVMIAVGLVGIVGLGLSSLLVEMGKQQNAANVKSLLQSQKLKIESLVKDSKSWSASVDSPLNDALNHMRCQRVPVPAPLTGCNIMTNDTSGFALLEASGGSTYLNSSLATNGFTVRGLTCNTFPSNQCPIRWNTFMTVTCQQTPPCRNPTIRVIARPEIPPAQLDFLKMGPINPQTYEVDVTRGVGTRFDPILIEERVAMPAPGAGRCTAGVTRKFSVVANDPASNIVSVNAGTGAVTFLPGSYQCRVTSPAFKVGTHTLTLLNGSTPIATGPPAISPQRFTVVSNAVLDYSIVISANTTFSIRHNCQFDTYASPAYTPGETTNLNLQMGFATDYTPPYAGAPSYTVYSTWACYRNG